MARDKAKQEKSAPPQSARTTRTTGATVEREPAGLPVAEQGIAAARNGAEAGNGRGAAFRARANRTLQARVGNARLNDSPPTVDLSTAVQIATSPPSSNGAAGARPREETPAMTPPAPRAASEEAVETPPAEEAVAEQPAATATKAEAPAETATGEETAAMTEVAAGAPAEAPAEGEAAEAPAAPAETATAEAGAEAAVPGAAAAPGAAAKPEAKAGKAAEGKEAAGGAPPAEAEAPAPPDPGQAIAPAAAAVHGRAAAQRRHPSASKPVGSAQAAAIEPESEKKRKAAEKTVAQLNEAEAREVEREQFRKKLRDAIREATPEPKTKSEADRVIKSGASDASKKLRGELATERDAAAGPMKSAAESEVSPSEQEAPPPTELQPEQAGPPPEPVSAAPVVPQPLPPERLDYSEDRAPTDRLMAENDITTQQLEEGNEPAFGPTLKARGEAEQHEATTAARYRETESQVQEQARGQAQSTLAEGLSGIHGERQTRIERVAGQQTETQGKDAAERKRITDKINSIKDTTRTEVNGILDAMEREAGKVFEDGLKRAEELYDDAFEEAKGGIGTWLTTWGEDWDRHIEAALTTARNRYLSAVDAAIDQVANVVATKLAAARKRVAAGRQEVEKFVAGLDESVRQYGQEALKAVSADFDAMEGEINQRRDSLVNSLTEQYKASYERMSAREEELRQANKSLWQRVYDATVGLVQKIIEFKNMLLGVLGRAANVIGDIIAHPIRFLGNLIDGVKLGLDNFVKNIGKHLQQALMAWLFGTLAEAGIQLPESFDLKGILSLVMQVLGLTYANIRKRAVNILGEELVSRLEQVAEIFKILITEGPGGLWEYIKEKLGDLKTMVIEGIKQFVIESIVMAGIKWVIGLLNPASAFIKACMAIYDIIKFFVERGSQILALINAIIDSLAAIVSGNIGVAAKLVEDALAKALPVVIGFLASLLGLGDISAKIRTIIEKIQEPINMAIDWVINQAVKLAQRVGGLFGAGKRDEERGGEEDLGDAKNAARDAVRSRLGDGATIEEVERVLPQIERELQPLGLKSLALGPEDDEGIRPVLAEASLKERISILAPKVIVAVSATIKVREDTVPVLEGILRPPTQTWLGTFGEDLRFREYPEPQRSAVGGTGRAAVLPPVPQPPKTRARRGSQPSAGLIIEPEAESRTLEIVAWNTRQPERGHNVSHAEKQFVNWFEDRPEPWRKRVESVDIVVEGREVCEICLADLNGLRERMPWIRFSWTGDETAVKEYEAE